MFPGAACSSRLMPSGPVAGSFIACKRVEKLILQIVAWNPAKIAKNARVYGGGPPESRQRSARPAVWSPR